MRSLEGDPDACWPWTGSLSPSGYGLLTAGGRTYRAHRVVAAVWLGDVPDGAVVCHRCDNPPCVNPAHLFVGTDRDNVHDKLAKGRARNQHHGQTHCIAGHEFTDENTVRYGSRRQCRACRAARHAAYAAEHREELRAYHREYDRKRRAQPGPLNGEVRS